MPWLKSGIGEIQQKLYRRKLRAMQPGVLTKLEDAEYQLGVLGYQYGEDCEEAHDAILRIRDVEQRQLDLANASAITAGRISDYETQIKKLEKNREAEIRELTEALKPLRKRHRSAAEKLRDANAKLHRLNATLTRIGGEKGETGLTGELKKAKGEFQLKRGRVKIDLEKLSAEESELREELAKTEEMLRERLSTSESIARSLGEDVHQQIRKKADLEKKLAGMEESKRAAFQEVGRSLAKAKIFPRNQPEALDRVVNLRTHLKQIDGRLAESYEISGSFRRTELVMFYLVAFGLVAGLLTLVMWLRVFAETGA